jgi:hypothetical protein
MTATLAAAAATAFALARLYRHPAPTWVGSAVGLAAAAHLTVYVAGVEPLPAAGLVALLAHATAAVGAAAVLRTPGPAGDLYAGPLRASGLATSCLAAPLLLAPAAGLADAWAGFAAWLGVVWLLFAWVWRREAFPAFQAALTWAAVLGGLAWVERQEWRATTPYGSADPRAVQAYGVAVGLLSVGWVAARRALRGNDRVRDLWSAVRPPMDAWVLGGLLVGQLAAAGVGLAPAVVAELTPAGRLPSLRVAPEWVHAWGAGAWLLLAVLATALALSLRLPADAAAPADGPLVGLAVVAVTVPVLAAGDFARELAAASAFRWGLALAFLIGSAAVWLRGPTGRRLAAAGFRRPVTLAGRAGVLGLFTAAGAVAFALTIGVAWLGLTGQRPSGPVESSAFARMGWTASTVVPLAVLVVGLAGTALRERSAGFASAGGLVFAATVAGCYALGVVTAGGALGPAERMRLGVLAAAAAAGWAVVWLAAGRRVPGGGLLTAQVVLGPALLTTMAVIPLGLLFAHPGRPLGPASARLGGDGWAALVLAVAAAVWHAAKAADWRFHAVGWGGTLAGVLAACTARPWDEPGGWVSFHALGVAWAVAGAAWAAVLLGPGGEPSSARRLWPELLAAGLVALGLRGGWADPARPLGPAGLALAAAVLFGVVGLRLRSRPLEYLSGLVLALAGVLVWVTWGPATWSSLALTAAAGLSLAGAAWAALSPAGHRDPVVPPGRWDPPPFPHAAAAAALALLMAGVIPTLAGERVDPPGLAWGAVAAVGLVLGSLPDDRRTGFAAAGVYAVGVAAVGLTVAGLRPGPVWASWPTPPALAGYVLTASGVAWAAARRDDTRRGWLVPAQAAVAAAVLGLAARAALAEPALPPRLAGPLAIALLLPAGAVLARTRSAGHADLLRPAALAAGVAALGLLGWAGPDPAGVAPWLQRNGWLFAALAASAVALAELFSRFGGDSPWVRDGRWVGGTAGALALLVLGLLLVQQVPVFDPATRRTPLEPAAVAAVAAGLAALIALAVRFALRPDRDPLGATPHGRAGYVDLAEVLFVLLFVHARLNVPEVFVGQAVRYWTFLVMLLAFAGVGLAEVFARRGVRVLAVPLLRTGVLLPLVPLVAFWARPPGPVTEFADARAPGLRPMLGYLEKLPQHFDSYAVLWWLAGLLYGLLALSRWSYGWALLGALATNAGLWAVLTHHQVPAAVHPQAWVIPLALIVLVSEHVHRDRLRPDAAAGLRYLGVGMIYVSSAADLFIAGVGQSLWLPVVLAALCLAGVAAGVLLRVRAFLFLGVGFLLLDVFAMVWHAAVDRAQTWVWYASGIVLGAAIIAVFAVFEKRRGDVLGVVDRLRRWD